MLRKDNNDNSLVELKVRRGEDRRNQEPTSEKETIHHARTVDEGYGLRLLITLGLNFIIPVAQIIGGMYANSMALISDAAHNFGDFAAIFIAYLAYLIGKKGVSARNTFGYRRAEIMAALFNGAILLGASFFIVYEALQRLHSPQSIRGGVVIWLAGIGIAGNGLSAWLLHHGSRHNLNVRGAFFHMMGDLFTSVVVLVNGVVLVFRPWYWLDPILSMLIVIFILKGCWSIMREATAILMNATPPGIDVRKIKESLEQIPAVCGVHYLHVWNISSSSIAFSCHVEVMDQAVSRTEAIAEEIRRALMEKFGIDHPVLQFETAQCGNGTMLCEVGGGRGSSGTDR